MWMLIKGWPQQSKILIIKWARQNDPFCGCHLVSFSSHPCYCPMSSWTKWPQWQRWKLCISSASWTSTHEGWLGHGHCWVANLTAAETNTEYPNGTSPWGDQPTIWWQVDYTVWHPLWKGHWFILTETDIYSWYGSAFPVHNASAKTIMHGFTECHIHQHGIAHRIVSNQGTHITAKDESQWTYTHGIH